MADNVFSRLSDDVIFNIFFKLEDDDPRNWARLGLCLHQILVLNSQHLLENQMHTNYSLGGFRSPLHIRLGGASRRLGRPPETRQPNKSLLRAVVKVNQRKLLLGLSVLGLCLMICISILFTIILNPKIDPKWPRSPKKDAVKMGCEFSVCKRRKICRSLRSHLASGVWNLSREQGNKLLASRFRGDCLYICDWPGCVHIEEKRNYMLFRGIFKNFKRSRVWRTINDGNRSKVDLNCAFCPCKQTWDLHSAFCLRRVFGYHDDGEPVVRAYVCENGHVSGAWTDWPLYT
ncbi:F-box family protein [Actinidia rufa]|uniref:F-box family protein n=1 Tax=Actinidia rufa TaxID=165716 RepID=A0A7J0FJ45_9ERIC|nr:F-box family protein [Actinidia rufa]